MNLDQIDHLLTQLPDAQLDYPFGPAAQVYKVRGKMFALRFERAGQPCVNLKCDPQEAPILSDIFPAISPGYHMNKKHWITVVLDSSVPDGELIRLIQGSWSLVVAGMARRHRDALRLRTL